MWWHTWITHSWGVLFLLQNITMALWSLFWALFGGFLSVWRKWLGALNYLLHKAMDKLSGVQDSGFQHRKGRGLSLHIPLCSQRLQRGVYHNLRACNQTVMGMAKYLYFMSTKHVYSLFTKLYGDVGGKNWQKMFLLLNFHGHAGSLFILGLLIPWLGPSSV